MSCYDCSSKFSLFKKEKTCGHCKLLFCANCLKHKFLTPNSSINVCDECNNKLTSNPSKNESDVPALLLKRLESMENPNAPPVIVFKSDKKLKGLKSGLSEEDKKLVERLEKLKEDRKKPAVPTDEEIRERLNALKGRSNEAAATEAKWMPQFVAKSESEQVNDLLKQCMEEVSLNDSEAMSDSEDDDVATSRVMERALAEAALPDAGGADASAEEPMEDQLPWCELCNEDATLKCISCDNALYCRRCLKESHDSFDLKNHRTVPFKKS